MKLSDDWKRPESVPFPCIWRRCKGRKPLPDGAIPSFWIQDVTEDLVEGVVEHMTTYYLEDEPTTSACGVRDDPLSLKEIQELWRKVMRQKAALVALTEEGQDAAIVGCNLTAVISKEEKGEEEQDMHIEGKALRTAIAAMTYMDSLVDPFEHYGVDKCLSALGLSVAPRFRGQGLGMEILRARFDLGRALGLSVTVTIFTAMSSQKLASRIGMEVLAEVPYNEYHINGQIVFPNMQTPSMKVMAKRIEPNEEEENIHAQELSQTVRLSQVFPLETTL